MKVFTPAALTALDNGTAIVTGAVEIGSSPPIRVWGGHGNITFAGRTFEGLGDSGIAEVAGGSLGGAAQNITLQLSGIDPETLALLDANEVKGAPSILWRLIFDQSGTSLLDFHIWARGRLDTLEREEEIGGTAALVAQLETAARGLGKRGGRMRSDADQRLIDPADGFFKNVSFAAEKTLYWGGRRPARAGSVLGGGGGSGSGSGADGLNGPGGGGGRIDFL